MREERGPWYLLTGLLIGAVLGLGYAWFYNPVRYVDIPPSTLSEYHKDRYRSLISAAFLSNGDLPRARARLNLLDDPDPARALAVQAQRALAEQAPEAEVNALGLLAVALAGGEQPASIPAVQNPLPQEPYPTIPTSPPPTATLDNPILVDDTPTGTPADASGASTGASTPTPTMRPGTSTSTPLPTRTPTPTPGAAFVLQDKSALCDIKIRDPLIIVNTLDAAGEPVPGVEVIVSWPGGEDRFFTGLKPELGMGYGDFRVEPGTSYSVHLAEGGELVQDLLSSECETRAGERFWGSWALLFAQP